MKYTVVWTPTAQDDLASLWIDAVDRRSVTAASNAADASLRADPYSESEPRDDVTRIMIVPPLAVAYDVSDADQMVTVWAVWLVQ